VIYVRRIKRRDNGLVPYLRIEKFQLYSVAAIELLHDFSGSLSVESLFSITTDPVAGNAIRTRERPMTKPVRLAAQSRGREFRGRKLRGGGLTIFKFVDDRNRSRSVFKPGMLTKEVTPCCRSLSL